MRVLIPMIGGIMLARYHILPPVFAWILAGFLFLMILLIILSEWVSGSVLPLPGQRKTLLAGIFQGLFLCMGGILGQEDEVLQIQEGMLQARICDEILESERTFKTRLDRVYYHSGEKWMRLEGRESLV